MDTPEGAGEACYKLEVALAEVAVQRMEAEAAKS
jgi:hypothetical protein